MKVAIYGTGDHGSMVRKICESKGIEIVHFVNSFVTEDNCILGGYKVLLPKDIQWDNIDWLIIASKYYIDEMLDNIYFYFDRKEVEPKILKDIDFREMVDPDVAKYSVANVNHGDISYLCSSSDNLIGREMIDYGFNWAEDTINKSFEIIEAYTDFNHNGYFFDVGANIGTTSIYVKKYHPQLKIYAFEPADINYKLFRVNCILNGVEDIVIEKMGVSDQNEVCYCQYSKESPGESRMLYSGDDNTKVDMVSLDSYVIKHGIPFEDLSYIWIDVEGFDGKVICGAQQCLSKSIPVVVEFWLPDYKDNGTWEAFIQIMSKNYSHFVDLRSSEISLIEINLLKEFAEELKCATDLMFIKVIAS